MVKYLLEKKKVVWTDFINDTIYQKAVCFQRAGQEHYNNEWRKKRLTNPKAELRTFEILQDPNYYIFIKQVNVAMRRAGKNGNDGGNNRDKKNGDSAKIHW